MWLVLGVCSALLLGFYDVAKKVSLRANAVIPVLFLSVACSSLLLLPFLVLSRETAFFQNSLFFVPSVNLQAHFLIFIKSLLVLSSWLCGYFAMKNLPITLVSPINATRPMWTLMGALIIFGEQLAVYQWVGTLIALVSFLSFSFVGKKEGVSFVHNKWIWCIVAATLLGAASGLYDKYLLRSVNHMAVQVYYTFYQCILMAIVVGCLWFPQRKKSTPFVWRWSILLISLLLVSADFFYFYALSLPDSLISVVSTVRRSGVVVPFIYGAVVFHDKNIVLKSICLLGVLIGMLFLFFNGV